MVRGSIFEVEFSAEQKKSCCGTKWLRKSSLRPLDPSNRILIYGLIGPKKCYLSFFT
jgi:hypothetical protein